MWWLSASDWMTLRFAADNPSTFSCIMHRAGPTAWNPRSALSEGFFLALWLESMRNWSTGGIFGFLRLVYSLRYLQGGQRGCRLPFSPLSSIYRQTITEVTVKVGCNWVCCMNDMLALRFGWQTELWDVGPRNCVLLLNSSSSSSCGLSYGGRCRSYELAPCLPCSMLN